jgi:hypothetical protein
MSTKITVRESISDVAGGGTEHASRGFDSVLHRLYYRSQMVDSTANHTLQLLAAVQQSKLLLYTA